MVKTSIREEIILWQDYHGMLRAFWNAMCLASRIREHVLIIKPGEQLKNHQFSKAFAEE